MPDISVFVTSDQISSERRVSLDWTIETLKHKLEPITGIPPSSQTIQFYLSQTSQSPISCPSDDTNLSELGITAYGRIHVIDTRPVSAREDFNDISQVEKYVMPESEYESRSDSVLAWKKKNHLGRFGAGADVATQEKVELEEIDSKGIKVGERCKLTGGDRRGTIRYVGKVDGIPGTQQIHWVGVELDEPTGKNDGSVKGTRYFQTKTNHGAFVKPSMVEVGDFPEEDLFSDDDDEL